MTGEATGEETGEVTGEVPGAEPVVVVGGGPAGLVLAWVLHRAAVPVVVVDRSTRAELGRLPKAGTMEHRVARMLEREGLGAPLLDLSAENTRCEFRTPRGATLLDYGALAGGRGHVVLAQHRLVDRVATALADAGVPLWFGHRVRDVRTGPGGSAVVVESPDGTIREVVAGAVVGADGASSAVARVVAAAPGARVHERPLAGRWLVVAAATPPLAGHTIYAVHPRGYAGHLRRGPDETRFYLEVPADEGPADWPHDALRAELAERLGVGDALDGVELTDVGVLDLRTRVVEPMQHEGVFLVGDAAHLITPAGGKGMNLALADAVELAHGLVERHRGDGTRLAAYSATRLPAIWRAQAFSDWFLRVFSTQSVRDGADGAGFVHGLREGWVDALRTDGLLARWFAHAYAGVED